MNSRTFEDKVILITGADGEIGTALIQEMLHRKAYKIYAIGIALEQLHQLASTCPSKNSSCFTRLSLKKILFKKQ